MSEDESVRLAKELLAAYNAHSPDRIARLLSETLWVDSTVGPMGPYGWTSVTEKHFKAFPDSTWAVEKVSGDDQSFTLEVLWTGTQMVPITRKEIRSHVRLTGRVEKGKIERLRVDYDRQDLRRQLALRPSDPRLPLP
ncbi:MAG TPA: nuclear transport factor 2 family protein [Thermoplasmata archaeon]|jgi:predicted ester cyclase|nr:nuclear transport factor 2 family protein [Thermoplasmata archaeon]